MKTPLQLAKKNGNKDVASLIEACLETKERMLDACLTGDEKSVRKIVIDCSDSVGFVFGEVDFLYLFSFFSFF